MELEIIKNIAEECGDGGGAKNTVSSLLPALKFWSGDKLVVRTIDDKAFFIGAIGKTHFRLYQVAVKESAQGQGYGGKCMREMKQICARNKLNRITLRTHKKSGAAKWYIEKYNGKIVGEKDNDYEMEVPII